MKWELGQKFTWRDEGELYNVYDEDGNLIAECHPLEIAALITQAPALLALIEAVEWVKAPLEGEDGWVLYCPWCKNTWHNNHAPDCDRQSTLARARGESAPAPGG